MYDSVIIGSGAAGSTVARKLAESGKNVLVLEKRPHIGGELLRQAGCVWNRDS